MTLSLSSESLQNLIGHEVGFKVLLYSQTSRSVDGALNLPVARFIHKVPPTHKEIPINPIWILPDNLSVLKKYMTQAGSWISSL